MWLKHFRHKKRTKKYQSYRLRYYEYRPEDVVELCRPHHTEVHAGYLKIIAKHALRLGRCRDWSWAQAEALMTELRAYCAIWLKLKTPGLDKLPSMEGVSQ